MEQQIMHYLNALKEDSEYFIEKQKKRHKNFDPSKMDAELDNDVQRDVRWHVNAINLFDTIIKENNDLKRKMATLYESVELLTQNQIKTEQRFLDEIANLQVAGPSSFKQPIGESSRVPNPYIKLTPPTFDPDKNSHPMQFLTALQNYVEATQLNNSDLKVILLQSL